MAKSVKMYGKGVVVAERPGKFMSDRDNLQCIIVVSITFNMTQ